MSTISAKPPVSSNGHIGTGNASSIAQPPSVQSGPAIEFEEEAATINTVKVFYGLLREPELGNISIPDNDDDRPNQSASGSQNQGGPGMDESMDTTEAQEKAKAKKKFKKSGFLNKKWKHDPNAPGMSRIPLPEIRDMEKVDRLQALKESTKRINLGPDSLPSVCFYTFLNAQHQNKSAVLCTEVSEDTTMIAGGLADSTVRIWSLTHSELRGLRPAHDLEHLDKESEDITYRMMSTDRGPDGQTGMTKVLCGHSGPVYGISFSPDKTLLLSCSEDATVRLWSLLTWTNICCYKGHCYPIWDVQFAPLGYYFATVSHDKTARLWGTDSHQPLRIFVGHSEDVDIVKWHHNCNYIATGSSDKCVRLWDNLDGSCVRLFIGHTGKISALQFSPCGRFILSGSTDERIIFWDIQSASKFVILSGIHVDTIYTLTFSRCGSVLVSGGADDQVVLWDYAKLQEENDTDYAGLSSAVSGPGKNSSNSENYVLTAYRTKTTSVLAVHFTRRNLLIAAGLFH